MARKRILWKGSSSYTIGDTTLYFRNTHTVDEELVKRLPSNGYDDLGYVEEVDPAVDPNASAVDPNASAVDPNASAVDPNADNGQPTVTLTNENTSDELTDAQKAYYTAHTEKQMRDVCKELELDIPDDIKSKSEVFKYMIENGFIVEG